MSHTHKLSIFVAVGMPISFLPILYRGKTQTMVLKVVNKVDADNNTYDRHMQCSVH